MNSNPVEDSRIARPVDDDFEARVRASVTPVFTPMFDQILNRLEAMDARITARSNRSSPERDHPPSPRRSEFAYVDDRRRHVDHLPTLNDDESRIQRALKQLKDGIKMRWDTKPMTLKAYQFPSLEGVHDGRRASY
jgi:hypothetical protein